MLHGQHPLPPVAHGGALARFHGTHPVSSLRVNSERCSKFILPPSALCSACGGTANPHFGNRVHYAPVWCLPLLTAPGACSPAAVTQTLHGKRRP